MVNPGIRSSWATHVLIAVCAVTWLIAAIHPYDFEAWALEQIAPLLCISLIVWASQHVQFSLSSWTCLTILFVLHIIGTHFTYSLTPYDDFTEALFGFSLAETLGWQRNQYDRFVHFGFGLLTAKPFFEFLRTYFNCSNRAAWFFSLHLIISASAIYELMEWIAAEVFSAETGALYLGSQGDIWDAQWDIALAIVGFTLVFTTSQIKTYLNAAERSVNSPRLL